MKTWKKVFAAVMLSAFAVSAQAGAIETLKKFNADTDGLSGSFSQTVKSKKKTQNSSGSFQILRPGMFKWNYSKPFKQVIVGDGKTMWIYDVDLKQVTKSDQSQSVSGSPAAILSGKTALENNYNLKEDGSAGGVDYVLATPKGGQSDYQRIRIGFKGETLATMELKDTFGNHTTIRFSGLNTKPNVSRSHFQFTPPKGVDVLSQ